MEKGRPLLRWAGILLALAAIFGIGVQAQGAQGPAKAPESGRPDLVKIDTLAAFEKLELPPVTFFHDKHTEALLKEKKGCEACHFTEDNQLSLAFKRKKATKPAEIKGIYHTNCIGCHNDMAAAGKKSGPLDGFCRSCHNAEPPAPARLDAGMNKVLHFRHVDARSIPALAPAKDNCGRCHHDYDRRAKKLVHVRGKEESCRVCHLEKPAKDVKSLEQASHLQCVLCHLDLANKGHKDTGPVVCGGCHGPAGQVLTAKKNQEALAKLPNKEVPRLLRGQPDAVLVSFDPKAEGPKAGKVYTMNPVPFDHKAHEKYNDSCRTCHHNGMQSCGSCHTLSGNKQGGFVTLERAMHLRSSQHSCVGCHAAKQTAPNCIGCHGGLAQAAWPSEASCRQCHLDTGTERTLGSGKEALTPAQKSAMADSLLRNRKMTQSAYPVEAVPDRVIIKELADKYQPVDFAHRKVVLSMQKGMKDSPLATYFHSDPGTMCQGCHHHSPPSKTPPSCGNCHAALHGKAAFNAKEANRPGLLAALHGQCMGCHRDMAVEPVATACTECHLEKAK